MARGGGIALKTLQLILRAIQWCCAVIILGIFSYYLATLKNHGLPIATWIRAVEGISGAGVLYTLIALLLVCFVGGIAFLSAFAMLLDLAFAGAFAYVAWATRGGAGTCRGQVDTPFGSGDTETNNRVQGADPGFTALPSLRTACKLQTACFAVAIVAAVFFILSIPIEFALIRHHRKERAFGPSPTNNYTAGSCPHRKFWQRKPKQTTGAYTEKANPNALPPHLTPGDVRTSYATESTAVNAAEPGHSHGSKFSSGHGTGAGATGVGAVGATHGYKGPDHGAGHHTAPQGSVVHPHEQTGAYGSGYADGHGQHTTTTTTSVHPHEHGSGRRNENPTGTF